MVAVGVDTHKHEHLARALDGLGQLVGGVTIAANPGRLPRAGRLTHRAR